MTECIVQCKSRTRASIIAISTTGIPANKANPSTTPSNPYITLTTETVDCASLTFEGIYNIERSNSLSFGVFSVSDGISDDAFKEDFEDTSGFFVDETGDTFDTTTTCKTTDSWFGDAL